MKEIKVGIIGVGVVGSALAKVLKQNEDIITARSGAKIIAIKGVSRDIKRSKDMLGDVELPLSVELDSVLEDDSIDIVVELMGGVDVAFEVAKKAIQKGKAFVTANKAMLAYHRYDLQSIATQKGKIPIGFEASVCGGIPIIKVLKDGLVANNILAIKGILNGTSNYILTKMSEEGSGFDSALKDAQKLGYAEADPSLDINGGDAAHKLLIISSIAFGIECHLQDIIVEGIESINAEDVEFAKEFGYEIKLLGIAKQCGDLVELRVHPTMIKNTEMLSKVSGVMNGISVFGDCVGESMYYGPGAGGVATASSVISDLIDITRYREQNIEMFGFKAQNKTTLKLKNKADIMSRFYIRLFSIDRPGALAQISAILGKHNISIKALLQKPCEDKEVAKLLFSTHQCKQSEIEGALDELQSLDIIKQKPYKIHIEE